MESSQDKIVRDMLAELERATEKFPAFHSSHEGYAIIKEELDELWEAIKKNESPDRQKEEALQVAAMALRFVLDLCRIKNNVQD